LQIRLADCEARRLVGRIWFGVVIAFAAIGFRRRRAGQWRLCDGCGQRPGSKGSSKSKNKCATHGLASGELMPPDSGLCD
jgi:hypothetical protein